MDESAKYRIHAEVSADGVVEPSDVVGAVFGQTEGLLGDELDIRDLQQTAKLGRIDVDLESERGRSVGHVTVASDLDRVQTAVLAAALETIDRVGPCAASIRVTDIEDARSAKRRAVVDRATELLEETFDDALTTDELVGAVQERRRVASITEYQGCPAGPRVAESDAVVVVEGRADVLALLGHGVKNAVAVGGADVPDSVASLTRERTATAFVDGDRGGDLVLRELAQVGDLDHVARAPSGRSVEDLDRETALAALREKRPADLALEGARERTGGDGDGEPDPVGDGEADGPEQPTAAAEDATSDGGATTTETATLPAHAGAVAGTGRARVLDGDGAVLSAGDADAARALLEEGGRGAAALVTDGVVDQALVDVAARGGVERVAGAERGTLTKQPTTVRVHTLAELAAAQ